MPTTTQGKAIAARNATSHGFFARDIVLPALGEDPGAYEQLYLYFCSQLNPRNLLERHYAEKIAAASWRLRRLQRWQAQLYEDPSLTEDERLNKLDKVLRHETALHRQIDTAVKMLAKDVPDMLTRRARAEVLSEQGTTERDCKDEPSVAVEVELETQRNLRFAPFPTDFNFSRLGNTHLPESENCENERVVSREHKRLRAYLSACA